MASGLSVLFLKSWPALFGVMSLTTAMNAGVQAARLGGEVRDTGGAPLAGAAITASPLTGVPPARPTQAVIDQKGREFIPHVLAIRTGTEVSFPNSDRIHHHVYSFSPAKRFEIKLYKGTPPHPIRFDQAGVVVLGCNIHDWMIGFVLVTDAPFFTTTDEQGSWSLELPAGDYTLDVWHPDLASKPGGMPATIKATEGESVPLTQRVTLKRVRRSGKPPETLQREGYSGEP